MADHGTRKTTTNRLEEAIVRLSNSQASLHDKYAELSGKLDSTLDHLHLRSPNHNHLNSNTQLHQRNVAKLDISRFSITHQSSMTASTSTPGHAITHHPQPPLQEPSLPSLYVHPAQSIGIDFASTQHRHSMAASTSTPGHAITHHPQPSLQEPSLPSLYVHPAQSIGIDFASTQHRLLSLFSTTALQTMPPSMDSTAPTALLEHHHTMDPNTSPWCPGTITVPRRAHVTLQTMPQSFHLPKIAPFPNEDVLSTAQAPETYGGFLRVFSSNSSQFQVYKRMLKPLVEEFLRGSNGMLAAIANGLHKKTISFGAKNALIFFIPVGLLLRISLFPFFSLPNTLRTRCF